MPLYHVPLAADFKVLTHTSTRRFSKNGFSQVGNDIVPKHQISQTRVTPSSIYNKYGVSGISEAGYGQRYPYKHLSYEGAGSYGAAGSRKLGYSGAGSYGAAGSRRLGYAGAGSWGAAGRRPDGSTHNGLADKYINDNPYPKLGDGFFDTLVNAAKTVTAGAVTTGTQAVNTIISKAVNPVAKPSPVQSTTTQVATPVSSNNSSVILNTALTVGAIGIGAFLLLRK